MSFCFSGGALGSTDSRGRLSRNSLIRRAASACNFARASAEAVSTGSDCCICGDIFIIVCKDVAPDVAIITQYSTTFGLEVTYGKAFKPPAARGEEERISGAFGFDTIMACICRDESRNRTAPSSDDNSSSPASTRSSRALRLFLASEALVWRCAGFAMIFARVRRNELVGVVTS